MKYFYPILLIAFFIEAISIAQSFEEDFSDRDITNNPSWLGDTAKFIVNPDTQLQLENANVTDRAILYVPLQLADTAKWEFYFKMDFNPSGSNSLEVRLASNEPLNKNDFKGYLLRIGESGGDDTPELVQRDGSDEVILIRGEDGLFAESPAARIRIRVNNGDWKMEVDTGDGYFTQGSISGYPLGKSNFFGIKCNHTATRSDKFYFDDFFISPLFRDTVAPILISTTVEIDTVLAIEYSEVVSDSSALNTDNYNLSGAGNPVIKRIEADPVEPNVYNLIIDSSFQNKETYTLIVNDITDVAGNISSTQSIDFVYFIPEKGDLIINEIFPDPNPSVGLPGTEFIEIYNPTGFTISLQNILFADANDTVSIGSGNIEPDSYIILCDDKDSSEYLQFGHVVGIAGMPALNNSGDDLKLISPEGILLDQVDYERDWYQDEDKSNGGWTLERYLSEPICAGKTNWRASSDPSGGTPGMQNSISELSIDSTHPHIKEITVVDNFTLLVSYNEVIAEIPQSVDISEGIGSPLNITVISDGATLELKLDKKIEEGIFYQIVLDGATDCYGNGAMVSDTGNFILPLQADNLDIVINEILFNPSSGGVDFLEIFNRSDKILPLQGLKVLEWDFTFNSLEDSGSFSEVGKYIFPGDYITFTTDSVIVERHYDVINHHWLLPFEALPNFPDNEGILSLYSRNGILLDSLAYSSDWHFELLSDENGVSLERIDPDQGTNDASNWTSSSEVSGFGTPTHENSQRFIQPSFTGEVNVVPEIFSPNQDGFRDFLSIIIQLEDPGFTGTVEIYDSKGRFIRSLANNTLLSSETTLRWDGLSDSGQKCLEGIYVVYIQLFHPDGRTFREKKKCVLAERR